MKLSKRIKQFRRGRHTKRSGKHTRRKYRGKQYKRTYRKNSRKLKNNKRIQRGGVNWISKVDQTTRKLFYTTTCNLTYKKKGELMKDDNPFYILLEHIESDIFRVTMTRQTTPEKQFVIYFKLTKDEFEKYAIYFSNTSTFVIKEDYKFLSHNSQHNWWICLRELILNNQIVTTEIYTFPLNEMNKEVFESFPVYMKYILESIRTRQRAQKDAQQQKERDEKIEKIKASPDYLKFYTDITDKVRDKKQQLDESTTYSLSEKQKLKKQLDEYMSYIIYEQLSAMNMEEMQPDTAARIYSKVQSLIRDNIDNFVTIVKPASSSEHYGENDGPALLTPEPKRTIIGRDEKGDDVYEPLPATHTASGYGYGSANGRDDSL